MGIKEELKQNTSACPDIYSREMLKELEKRVKAVKTALSGIDKNFEKVAFNLYWIYANKMYKAMGCESIIDYAEKAFDFGKTTTYSFISVVERFAADLEDNYSPGSIDEKYRGFSVSKLSLLVKLTDDEISSLGILPIMSVREIKRLVKDYENRPSYEESSCIEEKDIGRDTGQAGNGTGQTEKKHTDSQPPFSMPEPDSDSGNDTDDDGILGYKTDTVYEFSVLDDERSVLKDLKKILKEKRETSEESFFSLILCYPVRKGES